jgi:hypothetical protein
MVFLDFPPMRVSEEPLSTKSSFYLPVFEISRSCRTASNYNFKKIHPLLTWGRKGWASAWGSIVQDGGVFVCREGFIFLPCNN